MSQFGGNPYTLKGAKDREALAKETQGYSLGSPITNPRAYPKVALGFANEKEDKFDKVQDRAERLEKIDKIDPILCGGFNGGGNPITTSLGHGSYKLYNQTQNISHTLGSLSDDKTSKKRYKRLVKRLTSSRSNSRQKYYSEKGGQSGGRANSASKRKEKAPKRRQGGTEEEADYNKEYSAEESSCSQEDSFYDSDDSGISENITEEDEDLKNYVKDFRKKVT